MRTTFPIVHRRHFVCSAIVSVGLVLIPAAAAPQPAPATGDQRQPAEAAAPTPEGESVEHVKIDGFRSAHWGMDAAQIRSAVQKDLVFPWKK